MQALTNTLDLRIKLSFHIGLLLLASNHKAGNTLAILIRISILSHDFSNNSINDTKQSHDARSNFDGAIKPKLLPGSNITLKRKIGANNATQY